MFFLLVVFSTNGPRWASTLNLLNFSLFVALYTLHSQLPPCQKKKFSVKNMNLEAITGTLSWCKTWLLNGFNRIRVKQTLLRKRKRACKSSWSRPGNQKSFTLTTHWNLAKLVNNYPGIIVHLRLTLPRQQNQGTNFCSTVAFRLGRKKVG